MSNTTTFSSYYQVYIITSDQHHNEDVSSGDVSRTLSYILDIIYIILRTNLEPI